MANSQHVQVKGHLKPTWLRSQTRISRVGVLCFKAFTDMYTGTSHVFFRIIYHDRDLSGRMPEAVARKVKTLLENHPTRKGRGIYFRILFVFLVFVFFALGFWASWLLGFLASWLLGFLAFRPLGFLASWLLASGLLGFSASCWFMRLLALTFRILCIPSSSSANGFLLLRAFRWFMRLLAALAFGSFPFPAGAFAFAPFHWF